MGVLANKKRIYKLSLQMHVILLFFLVWKPSDFLAKFSHKLAIEHIAAFSTSFSLQVPADIKEIIENFLGVLIILAIFSEKMPYIAFF